MTGPGGPGPAGEPAGGLAREICRRIGANPAGPVAARLTAACAALTAAAVPDSGAARDELVARLIDGATNRETYFFRDRRQLAALAGILSGVGAGVGAPLTLWSAGCATGEEPYSLAILMLEAGLTGMVVGTDVSRAALAQARTARYRTGPMSPCREVTEQDVAFLPPALGGERTVAATVRAMVRLAEHNILTGPPAPGLFDAVVCRNVLVHMDGPSRTAALAVLAAALRPGGALLLGPGDVAPPADPADHGLRPLFRNGAALHIKADLRIKGAPR